MRIFAGNGMWVGTISSETPSGTPSVIGKVAPRRRLPNPPDQRARKRPSESTNTVSWPPTVATGTIGTPEGDRLAHETATPREHRLIALAPITHRILLTSRPQDHVTTPGQRAGHGLATPG